MNKDAVSVNPETRDLVALSAIYFLTSQWFRFYSEWIVPKIDAPVCKCCHAINAQCSRTGITNITIILN